MYLVVDIELKSLFSKTYFQLYMSITVKYGNKHQKVIRRQSPESGVQTVD